MFAGEGETRIFLKGWWNFKIDPYYQGEKEQWFSSFFKTIHQNYVERMWL